MATKHNLSDLTTQETGMFLQVVNNFRQKLSEDGDEELFIASLDYVTAKLAKVLVSALSFNDFWHLVLMCL